MQFCPKIENPHIPKKNYLSKLEESVHLVERSPTKNRDRGVVLSSGLVQP